MSWDSYIDNLLGHCAGHCDKACIIGVDGSKWTTDNHASQFKLTPAEAVTIGKVMSGDDYTSFQASGVLCEGVKYQFLRGDAGEVLAKKKDHGAVTLTRANTCVVIGHTKEGSSQGNTNKGVTVIVDYLKSLNL